MNKIENYYYTSLQFQKIKDSWNSSHPLIIKIGTVAIRAIFVFGCSIAETLVFLYRKASALSSSPASVAAAAQAAQPTALAKLGPVPFQLSQDFTYPFKLENHNIPPFQATEKLSKELIQLNSNFLNQYQSEIRAKEWHGFLSLQRLAWQDPKVLEFLSQEGATTTLLSAVKNKKLQIQYGVNLGDLLLAGAGSMLPSYLVTARPNLYVGLPDLEGQHIEGMGQFSTKEPAYSPIDETLAVKAISQFQKECADLRKTSAQAAGPIVEIITNASIKALENTIKDLANNPIELRDMVVGVAGGWTTSIAAMQGQCEGVMKLLDAAYVRNHGGYPNVLNFAMVSHALDARHLIAALGSKDHEMRAFKRFYEFCCQDLKAREQIRTRLQQCVFVIYSLRAQLGTSEDGIIRRLTQ